MHGMAWKGLSLILVKPMLIINMQMFFASHTWW